MSAVGRGRGRGRGWYTKCVYTEGVLGQTKPNQNSPAPGPSPGQQKASPIIQPPQINNNKINASQYQAQKKSQEERRSSNSGGHSDSISLKSILQESHSLNEKDLIKQLTELVNTSKNKEFVQEFIKLVCEKCINDAEFASIGAGVFNQLWMSEELRKQIQAPLLSTVQEKYTNRKKLNETDRYGLAVLLCGIFRLLRVRNMPLKPLNTPVCELLKELISDGNLTEDSVFYFFQEMERVGSTIDLVNLDSGEELINLVREIVISNDTILPSLRCRLVQLIELRAAKWSLADDVRARYEDLSQDLMAEGR